MENISALIVYSRGTVGISHHKKTWPNLYNEILDGCRTWSILARN